MKKRFITLAMAACTLASMAQLPVRSVSTAPAMKQVSNHPTPLRVKATVATTAAVAEAPENTQQVPFLHTLGKYADETALYTLLDADGDGKTWKPGGFTAYSVCMRPTDTSIDNNDDWLFSPAVELQAGKQYRVTIDCGRALSSGKEDQVEILFGTAATAEGMTATALPLTKVTEKAFTTFDADFSVSESGYYYFGIHCVSERALSGNLSACNFGIKEATPRLDPAAAGTLTYKVGEKGSLETACHYVAPALDVKGAELTGELTVKVLTNGKETHTFENVLPRQELDFVTTLANHGRNSIEAIAYRYETPGTSAKVDNIWAGPDTPCPVTGVKMQLSDDYRSVTLSWDPVSEVGEHGGWVNTEGATYYIFDAFGSIYDDALGYTEQTTCTINYTDVTAQDFVAYQITVGTADYNYSLETSTPIACIGDPDKLPWKESFDMGQQEQLWCIDPQSSSAIMTGIIHDNELQTNLDDEEATAPEYLNSQDGDNGFFLVLPTEKDAMFGFFSPKIALGNADNPVFEFYYQGKGSAIDAMISDAGAPFEAARVIDLKETPTDDWTLCRIPLADWKNSAYIQVELRVRGIHNTDETTWSVPLDNIRLRNLCDHDLALTSLSAPATAEAGATINITATVVNQGTETSAPAELIVSRDGAELATCAIPALEPDKSTTVTVPATVTVLDDETIGFAAKLIAEPDAEPSNNEAATTVAVKHSELPAVTAVTANSDEGNVILAWEKPEFEHLTQPRERAEGFEDEAYEMFTTADFGDWTMVDADGLRTYTFMDDVNNPKRTEPMAFQIWDPVKAGVPSYYLADMPVHSGDAMLVAFSAQGQNDNWLISPRLSGNAQHISFWGRGFSVAFPEEFEVYTSSADASLASFVKVDNVANYPANGVVAEDWVEYSIDVPAGTQYFAIRHTAYDSYALCLDDISFESAGQFPADLEIKGYNVYRDRTLVTDAPVAGEGHTDADLPKGTYTYHVSAVYSHGESRASAPVSILHNTSSADDIAAAGIAVSASHGVITVSGAKGKNVTIAAVNGILLHHGVATGDTLTVSAAPGLYLVSVDGTTFKVVL